VQKVYARGNFNGRGVIHESPHQPPTRQNRLNGWNSLNKACYSAIEAKKF
jgi:hypothetical protein